MGSDGERDKVRVERRGEGQSKRGVREEMIMGGGGDEMMIERRREDDRGRRDNRGEKRGR